MVDRTTWWLEAIPLKSISASTCTEVFFSTWVPCFGVMETVTSDSPTQFSSASWAAFCSGLGIRHAMAAAYHPQANGLVERLHRQLKDAQRTRGAGVDWPAHLPWLLLGLRVAPKEVRGISSAEAVFGQPLVMPGEVISSSEAKPKAFRDELASSEPPKTRQPCTYAEVVASLPDSRLQGPWFLYRAEEVVLPCPLLFLAYFEWFGQAVNIS
jgi:transposase InsO family protein